jgi:hypothetical protein
MKLGINLWVFVPNASKTKRAKTWCKVLCILPYTNFLKWEIKLCLDPQPNTGVVLNSWLWITYKRASLNSLCNVMARISDRNMAKCRYTHINNNRRSNLCSVVLPAFQTWLCRPAVVGGDFHECMCSQQYCPVDCIAWTLAECQVWLSL